MVTLREMAEHILGLAMYKISNILLFVVCKQTLRQPSQFVQNEIFF